MGCRVAVIGSNRFWGPDTPDICAAIGARLAELPQAVLITGGMPGVGERVGRSFWSHCLQMGTKAEIFHILPEGCESWDYGVTLCAGVSMEDRREILGRLPAVFVALEGGPGTAHEAQVAMRHGTAVVPVGRTGGYSRSLYPLLPCPYPDLTEEWPTLNDENAGVEQLARAVFEVVRELWRKSEGRREHGSAGR